MKTLVLTLAAATNPVSLLTHLVTTRHAYDDVILSRGAERVEYEQLCGYDAAEAITSPRLLEEVTRWPACSGAGDRLEPHNLPLALRLLSYAANNGMVRLRETCVDYSPLRGRQLPKWANSEVARHSGIMNYEGLLIAPAVGIFDAHKLDIADCLDGKCDLALDFNLSPPPGKKLLRDKQLVGHSGLLAASMQPSHQRWDAYRQLLDSAGIVGPLVDRIKEVAEERAYKDECLWWIPRQVGDALTGGALGLIEMLYTILRRRTRSPSDGDADER